jgi:hypothetical protein
LRHTGLTNMENHTSMTNTKPTSEPLLRLRVLTEFDETYRIYVSRCLETGHVVTADDPTAAVDMMRELLDDEIAFAVEHKNFPNLFSNPASFDVWIRYKTLAKINPPKTENRVVDARELRLDDESEVSTEITYARAATH